MGKEIIDKFPFGVMEFDATGTEEGICCICNRPTVSGVNFQKVVSANFMDWDKITNTGVICDKCIKYFSGNIPNGGNLRRYNLYISEIYTKSPQICF